MARTRAAIAAAARNGMAARRQQVAALLHAGFQQCEIAEQLGVSEATVSGDCAVLREQWRVAAAVDYAEVAAAALAALDGDEAGLRELLGQSLSPRDRVAAQR
jgi:FixJ family two-component response regulator